MTTVLIVYHSQLGSVRSMADLIARGVASAGDSEAMLRTVPALSAVTTQQASVVPESGAPYVTLDELANCDGLIIGSPTRFGNMSAEMKHFLDSSSQIWMRGDLINKPAAVFGASSSMHGGQETTLLSMMIPLLHHGMVLAGIPYSEKALHKTTSGGTPYGATHVAGSNNDQPISDDERALCIALGKRVATLAKQLKH